MLDCATRVPDHQVMSGGYYPGFIYSQPAFNGADYSIKSDLHTKDYQRNGSPSSTNYPHSPVETRTESHPPSSQSPPYNHTAVPSSNPYYYPYTNCLKTYPVPLVSQHQHQIKSDITQPQYAKSDINTVPQYVHQPSVSPNSLHRSPSSGSSISNSPSPLADNKQHVTTGLYWPTTASLPPYPAHNKTSPSPPDYSMFQHLHHQGTYN